MADDRSGHDQQRVRPEATHHLPSPWTTIATDIPDLRLVALSPDDAEAHYDLVDRRHGMRIAYDGPEPTSGIPFSIFTRVPTGTRS